MTTPWPPHDPQLDEAIYAISEAYTSERAAELRAHANDLANDPTRPPEERERLTAIAIALAKADAIEIELLDRAAGQPPRGFWETALLHSEALKRHLPDSDDD